MAANDQVAPGRYRDPGPGPGLDDEALGAPRDLFKGDAHAAWTKYVQARNRLDASTRNNAELVVLHDIAFGALMDAGSRPSADAWQAVVRLAGEATSWIEALEHRRAQEKRTRKNPDKTAIKRFRARLEQLSQSANACEASLGKKNPKRQVLKAVLAAVTRLETESGLGVSEVDLEDLADLERRVAGLGADAPLKPPPALPAHDPDDDDRTGTEATLTYRGQQYFRMPGFDPPLYGRIDNAQLRLLEEPLGLYQAAMEKGKIPANEQGDSGVKEKPMFWEIKLIARTAKRIGVGATTRLIHTEPVQTQALSTGRQIRYLVFDKEHDAH